VEMRLYFPPAGEGETKKDLTAVCTRDVRRLILFQKFVQNVLKGADTTAASGKGILSFEQVPILVPRYARSSN
jgi:hypothetical protein